MENFYQYTGKRIRMIRMKKHISQEKLAEMTKFSVTHMSHIENGSMKLSVDAVIRIANALETNADSILCDCLVNAGDSFKNEIIGILQGYDDREIRVIWDLAKTLKMTLKKNYGKSTEDL